MNESLRTQMVKLRCGPPPTTAEYDALVSKIDFPVGSSFLEWMRACSQAAGLLSSDEYIQFWKIADIIALNPYYDDVDEARDLFFFGSDGSSLGYAFDKTNGNVVSIEFLDICDSSPEKLGESFLEFLENLAHDGA